MLADGQEYCGSISTSTSLSLIILPRHPFTVGLHPKHTPPFVSYLVPLCPTNADCPVLAYGQEYCWADMLMMVSGACAC